MADYLHYGSTGPDVAALQQILREQGFLKEPESHFQRLTRNAVIAFQQRHIGENGNPLRVTGVVDAPTMWALQNPSGDAQRSFIQPEIPAGLTPQRKAVLQQALEQHAKGVSEQPDGSNWSDDIAQYGGAKGTLWGCFFWSWCHKQWNGRYPLRAKFGYPRSAWFRARSVNRAFSPGSYLPIPGDAFVSMHEEGGKIIGKGHIGFVLRVEVSEGKVTRFNTIEGNAGNRVKVGLRRADDPSLMGFINPYPADEQPGNWIFGVNEPN